MKKIYLLGIFTLYATVILGQSWSTTGNSGTSSSTNFLGTTDSSPLVIKVNNNTAGYTGHGDNDYANVSFGYKSLSTSTSGGRNVALGVQALTNNSTGWSNIAIGYWAMDISSSGSENIAIGTSAMSQTGSSTQQNIGIGIGTSALKTNQGTLNTAVGTYSLNYNTSGSYNTAIGGKSLLQNTTGTYNTAVGMQAMQNNTTGEINAGFGTGALYSNITGSHNTALGNAALWSNTSGSENTSIGDESLAGNIDGSYNVAIGTRSMWCGDSTPGFTGWGHGNNNTATGWESLRVLTTGNSNSAFGYNTLLFNTSGSNNSAFGNGAMSAITTGSGNVGVGTSSLATNSTGSYNTAIGYQADIASGGLENATAIGYGANASKSNAVVIGNKLVTSIGGISSWSTLIDDNSKQNVSENVPGLTFINQLQPITFSLASNTSVTYTGFLNESVKNAATNVNYSFNGIDENESSIEGLRYSEFAGPMVQAIKDLSAENSAKDSVITALQSSLDSLKDEINSIKTALTTLGIQSLSSTSLSASLKQNYPNPYSESTTIEYSLPESYSSAYIQVYNNSDDIVKRMTLTSAGDNSVNISASSLKTGVQYYYPLIVDGKLIDTKKMLLK